MKTSMGLGGAMFYDVELFEKHIESNVRSKAAGGISSREDAKT